MKKYTLKHPIKDVDGNEIKELTFGQLKAKHLAQIPSRFLELAMDAAERSGSDENVDAKAELKKSLPELIQYIPDLISALTDIPKEIIGELSLPDLFGCFETLEGDFFGGSGLPEGTGPQAS